MPHADSIALCTEQPRLDKYTSASSCCRAGDVVLIFMPAAAYNFLSSRCAAAVCGLPASMGQCLESDAFAKPVS